MLPACLCHRNRGATDWRPSSPPRRAIHLPAAKEAVSSGTRGPCQVARGRAPSALLQHVATVVLLRRGLSDPSWTPGPFSAILTLRHHTMRLLECSLACSTPVPPSTALAVTLLISTPPRVRPRLLSAFSSLSLLAQVA